MKKLILCALVFACSILQKSWGQTELDKFEILAGRYLAENNLSEAINLYERLLFFGENQRSKFYLPLARAYSQAGQHEKASYFFNQAFSSQNDRQLRNSIVFESALNYMLGEDYILAYAELMNVDHYDINGSDRDKYYFLLACLDYKNGKYTSSQANFDSISILSATNKKQILAFFKKTKKLNRRYNPTMVEWMSLIPGLGQAWCGYYKESANAFLLTSALVALYIDVSIKYNILDGLLTVYPWFNRYYKGGVLKASKLARMKRDSEKNNIYNHLLKNLPPI